MPKAKKFLVTTATSEITFYRSSAWELRGGLCSDCDAATYFFDLNEAADASGAGALVIIDAIRAGNLHVLETSKGHLLICRNSLLKWKEN